MGNPFIKASSPRAMMSSESVVAMAAAPPPPSAGARHGRATMTAPAVLGEQRPVQPRHLPCPHAPATSAGAGKRASPFTSTQKSQSRVVHRDRRKSASN